jgi:hypothetical protein
MDSVFRKLPDRFFAPLASGNRELHAIMLLRFYRLFQDYQSAVERAVVISDFERWLEANAAELRWQDEEDGESPRADEPWIEQSPHRTRAALLVRRLQGSGWMLEEETGDFVRLLAMPDYAVPFYQALAQTDGNQAPEYEGRIFGIHQLLSGPAAREHGDLAVGNAHEETRRLSEAMKSLEQSIKNHLEILFSADLEIPDILRAHYQEYQTEVVDKVYNRIKTSDHLSRFRPAIIENLQAFLADGDWMTQSALQLARRGGQTPAAAEETIRQRLLDIQDELRNLDPLIARIDDKNRRYSRLSTERIKSRLHGHHGFAGQLSQLLKRISAAEGHAAVPEPGLEAKLYATAWLGPDSLYRPRVAREDSAILDIDDSGPDRELLAAEMLLRIQGQLDQRQVREFLAKRCPAGVRTAASDLVATREDLVHLMYAAVFATRLGPDFPFDIVWESGEMRGAGYRFPAHWLVARNEEAR